MQQLAMLETWRIVLCVTMVVAVVVTVVVALRRDAQARERQALATARALARANVARTPRASMRDSELASAWRAVCDVLERDVLSNAADVRGFAAKLTKGDRVSLLEEASVDVDEESSDRFVVYHAGFDPPNCGCAREAFLLELERLASALDALERSA